MRGLRKDIDALGLFARAVGLHELCPDHADRAELGDLHEEVGTQAEVEADVLGRLVHGVAPLHHGVDVGKAGGQGRGRLLDGVGAAVVIDGALHVDGLQLRRMVGGVLEGGGHLIHVALEAAVEAALLDGLAHGISAHAAGQRRVVVHLLLPLQNGGKEGQRGGTGVDGQGGAAELDLIEEGLHVLQGVQFHGIHVEVHGAGALVELLQQDLVGLDGVPGLNLLGDLPGFLGIAGGLGAPEEVSGAGEAQALLVGGGLFFGVDGGEHDALRRLGEQLLLEDATLQTFDGRGLPGLVGGRRKFIESDRSQRFGVRFGIHHNILSSIIYHYRRGCTWRPADTAVGRRPSQTPKRTQRGASSTVAPGSCPPDDRTPSSGGITVVLRQVFWLMAFPSGAPSHERTQWPLRPRSH